MPSWHVQTCSFLVDQPFHLFLSISLIWFCLSVLHLYMLFAVHVCAHTHAQVHMDVLAHTHVEVRGQLLGDSPLDQHPFHSVGFRYRTQIVRLDGKGLRSTNHLTCPCFVLCFGSRNSLYSPGWPSGILLLQTLGCWDYKWQQPGVFVV